MTDKANELKKRSFLFQGLELFQKEHEVKYIYIFALLDPPSIHITSGHSDTMDLLVALS